MPQLANEDVQKVLSRSLGDGYQILDHQLKQFTESKHGIFGSHQQLIVRCRKHGKINETHTYFVKSPPESSAIRHDVMDEETFIEEINFYENIHPIMTTNCVKWSPNCYLIKNEVMVFEDLRRRGYRMRDDVPYNEMEFLKTALTTLGRFHGASIVTEAKIGKRLTEAFPTAFVEKMYSKSNKFGKCTLVGFDTIRSMATKLGIKNDDDDDLVNKMYERARALVKRREGRCNVACHSDLWKNNLLLNDNNDCLLVDFQLLRYASPACDIGMLIYLHTSPAFRRLNEYELLFHYHAQLIDTLTRSNNDVVLPRYDELEEDYRESRLIGMLYASLYLPAIYLKSDDFERLLNEPDELRKWFFDERITLIADTMEKDSDYEAKIRSIVEELFEEARRIFGG